MKLSVANLDGQLVDARMPLVHQSLSVELPILVPIGAKPITGIIVVLICEPHGNASLVKGPQFLDESIIQLPDPLPSKERDDLLPAGWELCSVSPAGVRVKGGRGGRVVGTDRADG
jgi:hypothetical protein